MAKVMMAKKPMKVVKPVKPGKVQKPMGKTGPIFKAKTY